MKHFIMNLENRNVGILISIVGVLMVIFPQALAELFPYMLGAGLMIRGAAVIFLTAKYKERSNGPGKVILYWVLGLVIMILGSSAVGIIGVIWAVFSLEEVSGDVNEMWRNKRWPIIHIITAVISVVLAVMLIIDPFKHFVTHVMILGLEIISSCFARLVDSVRSGVKSCPDTEADEKHENG